MAEHRYKTDLHVLVEWLRNRKHEAGLIGRPSLAQARASELQIWANHARIDARSPCGAICILRSIGGDGFFLCCFERGPFQVYYHFKTVDGAGLAVFALLAAGEKPLAEPELGYG